MSFFKKLIFWGLLIVQLVPAVSSAKVLNFIVNVPFSTPENSKIYLTGDIPLHCSWQPDCLLMKLIGVGTYSLTILVPDHLDKFDYKITRGSWDNEAADSYSTPYPHFSASSENIQMPIVQNIVHWKDLPPLKKNLNVLNSFFLHSNELGVNKEISVYLPPSYNHSNKSYPVIYMHDGQNVFDPSTSSYGVEWSIDETMNKLIASNKINEAIVVAIHTNNTDRWLEYDYFLKGKNYSDFLANSVIPFTEQNFRAIKNKDSRFMMGSSMGALISLMIIIDRPDLFSKIAGLSFPAFIDDRAIFRYLSSKKTLPAFDFYMDHGDWGIDSKYAPSALELYNTLIAKGLEQKHLKYLVFPYADHSEADWARRAYIPLEFLLNK